MITPRQEIRCVNNGRSLLIKIYDMEELGVVKAQELIYYFEKEFINIPLDFLEIIIKVVSIYPGSAQYTYGIKFSNRLAATNSVLMTSVDLALSLKVVLKFFLKNMEIFIDVFEEFENDLFGLKAEGDDYNYNNPLGLMTDPINIDEILADFEAEEKRKKEE